MPATNRGGLRAPGVGSDYFKVLPPSLMALRNGLAIFGLLIIARYFLTGLFKLLRPTKQRINARPVGFPAHTSLRLPPWANNEKVSVSGAVLHNIMERNMDFPQRGRSNKKRLSLNPSWTKDSNMVPKRFMTRLPPGPPLTPPELSTTVFSIQDRQQSLDDFIGQPNPDYTSSTSTSVSQNNPTSPSAPQRRSYTKTIPIGIPATPRKSALGSEEVDLITSPSSYPPASPLLPPAPYSLGNSRGRNDALDSRDVEVTGEIISALDGEGAGWTRHTRVYGGGVCLACAASGGDHGGGFYGATVSPEEMR